MKSDDWVEPKKPQLELYSRSDEWVVPSPDTSHRKTVWTKPPRSLYGFLGQFDTIEDDLGVERPADLDEWLSLELDLDSSDSEHCHDARKKIELIESREKFLDELQLPLRKE